MRVKLKIFILEIFLFFAVVGILFPAESNKTYIDLTENAQKTGMTFYWDPFTQSGLLEKNGHQVSFRNGDGFVLEDYKKLRSEDSPIVKNGEILVSLSFFNSIENFFKTQSDANPYKIGAILIDPGHGGKDPGASDTHTVNGKKFTVQEKNVNLAVGLKLYDYLKKAYPDKKILMTRNNDTYLTLAQRTEIANNVKLGKNEAILYVSVHVNASLDKSASGYEVWYLTPGYRRQVIEKNGVEDESLFSIMNSMMEEEYTTESILIAKFIIDGINAQVGSLSSSRGVKAEEWFVVKNSNMPSVLIETGFLTNPKEAALLADDKYLQKLSFGIYNGLQAFVTHFERSRGFTGSNE